MRRVMLVGLMASVVGLSGCTGFFVNPNSGGSGDTTVSNAVYAANGTAGTVSGWVIGTGTLTAVSGLPGALNFSPIGMAVSRSNGYVWISQATGINAYTIGSGGSLNLVGTVAAYGVVGMATSPDGNWVVGFDLISQQTIDVFQVTQGGGLTLYQQVVYGVPSGTTPTPKMIRFAPDGQYFFAALGTSGVAEFAFNEGQGQAAATGVTILPGGSTSDNAVLVNAASSVVYVARSGTNQVLAYGIGTTGALTAVSGSPFTVGSAPYDLAIATASGGTSYLYVANRSDGTVGVYTVNAAGGLTAVTGSPFAAGSGVQSLAVDSTGTYLLAGANGGSPDVTMYSMASGVLTKVATATPATNDGLLLLATTY